MKKNLLTRLIAISTFVILFPAQAGTVNGNFNVTVNLTSVCTMAAIGDLAFGTYTAFQAGIQTATNTTATLTCTRGLTGVTANFDTAATGSTAAGAATNAVGAGVIAGLEYNITATANAAAPGTAATASTIGTADTRTYTISGTMPASQAGTGPAGVATQVRTLTVNY